MGDSVGGSVLAAILLAVALWAITRPSGSLGRSSQSLEWLRPVSRIVFVLFVIWGIKKYVWDYFWW